LLGNLPVSPAELRERSHRGPVLLIDPRELQPELPLGCLGSGGAAREEYSQGRVSMDCQIANRCLQDAEFVKSAAG
jgi:hypothetical protein